MALTRLDRSCLDLISQLHWLSRLTLSLLVGHLNKPSERGQLRTRGKAIGCHRLRGTVLPAERGGSFSPPPRQSISQFSILKERGHGLTQGTHIRGSHYNARLPD